MTATLSPRTTRTASAPEARTVAPRPEITAAETTQHRVFRYSAAVTRLALGWVFLWAFLDKTFALGFATGRNPETGAIDYLGDAAWINGASPTEGFLTFGTKGPLADFYAGLAGNAFIDWLFMLGLLGIGLALVLGIGMRIAAATGSLLLVMMWSAALWPANNPFVEADLVYAIVLIALAAAGAGKTWGLGKAWERLAIVQKYPILK